MKLYLIAVLFLATFVVVPCLAEEELGNAATANVADVPEDKPVESDPPGGETGNEEQSDEEQSDEEQKDEGQKDEDSLKEKEDEESNEGENEEADEKVPEEFQDEVEQVKRRRFPQLSHLSCMILKRYGHCKNKGIARFCVRGCGPPPCLNKISRGSCLKVKNAYRACNHHIGRVYCKHTCGHCKPKSNLPAQCRLYKAINDVSRRQSKPRGNLLLCDNKITEGWYRFEGLTGKYIPNKCVPSNRCGTHAAGWVVGNYPTVSGLTVTRQVCFNWSKNCCYNAKWWKIHIQITNCGNYYVFYLRRPRACSYRYCGNL